MKQRKWKRFLRSLIDLQGNKVRDKILTTVKKDIQNGNKTCYNVLSSIETIYFVNNKENQSENRHAS